MLALGTREFTEKLGRFSGVGGLCERGRVEVADVNLLPMKPYLCSKATARMLKYALDARVTNWNFAHDGKSNDCRFIVQRRGCA